MSIIKIKRGIESAIKSRVLERGEPAIALDSRKLFVGDGTNAGGFEITAVGASAFVWEVDINGDVMPVNTPTANTQWGIDAEGDIMPGTSILDSYAPNKFYVETFVLDSVAPPTETTLVNRPCLSFEASVDEIVWCEIPLNAFAEYSNDINVGLTFAMDSANTGNVVINMDYYVFSDGQVMDDSTPTNSDTITIDPNNAANVQQYVEGLIITGTDITNSNDRILVKLTRDADNVSDTHTGNFCLFDILAYN